MNESHQWTYSYSYLGNTGHVTSNTQLVMWVQLVNQVELSIEKNCQYMLWILWPLTWINHCTASYSTVWMYVCATGVTHRLVIVRWSEGVFLYTPARREDDKVNHRHTRFNWGTSEHREYWWILRDEESERDTQRAREEWQWLRVRGSVFHHS